ncbi:hypothetical protein PR048_032445 [Dryococelus australis]|uniref:Uncharacterized protein n=1 Tax=Dryococelus australis TaxID=614101 RepID=A0ABQ9G275_9NEOP|nr:hypothetical protein PR048_032445 [Dryococelus australis]
MNLRNPHFSTHQESRFVPELSRVNPNEGESAFAHACMAGSEASLELGMGQISPGKTEHPLMGFSAQKNPNSLDQRFINIQHTAALEYRGGGTGHPREDPSGTIPTCENPGATLPGIEPGSPMWEAGVLTTTPPRPLKRRRGERKGSSSEIVKWNHVIWDSPGLSLWTRCRRLGPWLALPTVKSPMVSSGPRGPVRTSHPTTFDLMLGKFDCGLDTGSLLHDGAFHINLLIDCHHGQNSLSCSTRPHGKKLQERWVLTNGSDSLQDVKRLVRSPPTMANRLQSPAGSQDFLMCESCRTMPLVGGFSRGSPVSPALSFRRCSILTSITLIDSQDLAVKISPNLFLKKKPSIYLNFRTELLHGATVYLPTTCSFSELSLYVRYAWAVCCFRTNRRSKTITSRRPRAFQKVIRAAGMPSLLEGNHSAASIEKGPEGEGKKVSRLAGLFARVRARTHSPPFVRTTPISPSPPPTPEHHPDASNTVRVDWFRESANHPSSSARDESGRRGERFRLTLWPYIVKGIPSNVVGFIVKQLCKLWAAVDERLDCSPPNKANRVQSPAGSLRIFACGNRAERCRWSTSFLGVLPRFPPPLHYRGAPFSPVFAPISSQYLVVKSCPNVFTHFLLTYTFYILLIHGVFGFSEALIKFYF